MEPTVKTCPPFHPLWSEPQPSCKVISVFVQVRLSRTSFSLQWGFSQVKVKSNVILRPQGVYFLRRTAVLIFRPAIACCPAGEAVKDLFDLEKKGDFSFNQNNKLQHIVQNIVIKNKNDLFLRAFKIQIAKPSNQLFSSPH